MTLLLAVLLAGCANITYYLQSVRGQLDIWSRQRDIESVIASPETAEPLRQKLRAVLTIRESRSRPRNASYRSYANLDRSFAVWNVFAAPEFSMQPQHWCFLFASCAIFVKPDDEERLYRFSQKSNYNKSL